MTNGEAHEGFMPCPTCKQYSHSLGEDKLAEALMHFESMYGHPVRGHPMGHNFDEKTRDAAQVLMAAARLSSSIGVKELVEAAVQLFNACRVHDPDDWEGEPSMVAMAEAFEKAGIKP